jgi:hypothetical protein
MEPWSVAHRVFVYNTFIETGRSVVLTQRRFRNNFNVGRHGRIPKRDTIMKWVNSFQTTGSLRPGTAQGGDRTVHLDLHFHPYKIMLGTAAKRLRETL